MRVSSISTAFSGGRSNLGLVDMEVVDGLVVLVVLGLELIDDVEGSLVLDRRPGDDRVQVIDDEPGSFDS